MELLRSRPGQYPLLLELRDAGIHANPLDEARRATEKLLEMQARHD